jgi:hypothetical protein
LNQTAQLPEKYFHFLVVAVFILKIPREMSWQCGLTNNYCATTALTRTGKTMALLALRLKVGTFYWIIG